MKLQYTRKSYEAILPDGDKIQRAGSTASFFNEKLYSFNERKVTI
jgi:hypothetical protein